MESPPTYQELFTELKKEKQYIHELEKQIKELKQETDYLKKKISNLIINEYLVL